MARRFSILRLTYLLGALIFAIPAIASAKWEVTSKVDPLTDQRITRATLTGQAFSLNARCTGEELEAWVFTDEFITTGGSAPVTYRFDRQPPKEERWTPSTEGVSVFTESPREFINEAIKASSLIIQVEDFRGTDHRATLTLAGSAAPLKRVLDACPKSDLPPVPQSEAAPTPEPMPALPPLVITDPNWIRMPTAAEINREFPERAMRLETAGRAEMRCTVSADGGLTKCSVTSETPTGMGFGSAALRVARYFRIRPTTTDGRPTAGATVAVPLVFAF